MKCLYYILTSWILISTSFLSYKSSAQEITFNKKIGILDSTAYEYSTSILETKNGYLIAGGGSDYDSTFQLIHYLFLYETNLEGDLLWSKVYASNDSVRFGGSFRGIFQLNDTVYEAIGEYFDFTDSVFEPTYYQFDLNGNLIYQKVIYNVELPDTYYLLINAVIKSLDGGFFISATMENPYSEHILKYDANHNLQWENIYEGYRIVEVGQSKIDSTFYFSALVNETASLLRLDKNGELIFEESVTGPAGSVCGVACAAKDEGFILISPVVTEGYEMSRLKITKFDGSGNSIWSKSLNKDYRDLRLFQVHCDVDGSIILTGSVSAGDYHNCAYFYRFTEDGDSLLFKMIHSGDNYSSCDIYRSCATRDFYVLGVGIVSYQNPENQQRLENWLLKLDWYACDSAVCENATVFIDDFNTMNLVCEESGQTSLIITARGDSIAYQWQKRYSNQWVDLSENEGFSGSNNDTLIINRSLSVNDTVFRCKVFDSHWERYTPDLLIREIGLPVISPFPDILYATENSNITLYISAFGYDDLAYQWYFNGSIISGADTPDLLLKNLGYQNNGIYNCIVSDTCGSVLSDTIFLHILGISELLFNQTMRVFPNPNNGKFSITINDHYPDGIISIYTSSGIKLYEKSVTGLKSNFIDLNKNLLPGCYFIRFTNRMGIFSTKFILIE